MSAPKSPPPGAMPGPLPSPDVQSMMQQFSNKSGGAGVPSGAPAAPTPAAAQQHAPRGIGTPVQEAQYLAKDVQKQLTELVIPQFLRPHPNDSPEDAAKKQKLFQNFQKLTGEEQRWAEKEMAAKQKEAQQKQQLEQETAMKKQQDDQRRASIPEPSSKKQGAGAGKPNQSRKTSAIDDLNQKRKMMSNPTM